MGDLAFPTALRGPKELYRLVLMLLASKGFSSPRSIAVLRYIVWRTEGSEAAPRAEIETAAAVAVSAVALRRNNEIPVI